jgi:hypothetical protein
MGGLIFFVFLNFPPIFSNEHEIHSQSESSSFSNLKKSRIFLVENKDLPPSHKRGQWPEPSQMNHVEAVPTTVVSFWKEGWLSGHPFSVYKGSCG